MLFGSQSLCLQEYLTRKDFLTGSECLHGRATFRPLGYVYGGDGYDYGHSHGHSHGHSYGHSYGYGYGYGYGAAT